MTPGDHHHATTDRRQIALLLALGLALRLVWMVAVNAVTAPIDVGEATHAALAFARTGQIADAFFPGQGPTAHLLPTMVVLAGGMLRLFGAQANLVLAAWALAQSFASFLLLRALFARIGTDRAALRGGLAILCLLPVLAPQETCDFRFWEGALGLCLAAANLLLLERLERLDRESTPRWRALLAAAALAAFTFFVSPPAGVAVALCWAVYALRRLPPRRTLAFAAAGATALALLIAPWMLRNERALGQPIALRSNFGLETAVANHPAALSGAPRAEVFRARMLAIHPFDNPPAIAALRSAGGEIAYSAKLGRETRAWIAAHPGDFLRLSLRHYRQFYVPDAWQLRFTNWPHLIQPRAIVMQLVGILGLAGLAWGLVRRRPFYRYLALYVATAGLPYALVQPIPRYSYLVYGLLAYCAAQLLADLATGLARHRRRANLPAAPTGTAAP